MMETLEQEVIEWAEQKGIFDMSTNVDQMKKMLEEVEELDYEVHYYDSLANIQGELGDVLVCAVIQAKFHGLSLSGCLNQAVDKITKRTGQMKNGVFVKDS